MSGHVWFCLGMLGCVQIGMDMFGGVGVFSGMFGYVWICLDVLG